jgi:hypothetical protein
VRRQPAIEVRANQPTLATGWVEEDQDEQGERQSDGDDGGQCDRCQGDG